MLEPERRAHVSSDLYCKKHQPRTSLNKALFGSKKMQNFSDSSSHQIFGHMYETLNIDKK
jgi:hypothetical protein